jgi:hypothetical protein
MTGYIAIVCGIFVFSVFTVFFSSYGAKYDLEQKRISNVLSNTQRDDYFDEELNKPLYERLVKPLIKALLKIIPKNANTNIKKT